MKLIQRLFLTCFLVCIYTATTKAQSPSWAQDIAPILYSNCTSCHHTGGLAPNSLMTFTDAFNYRFMIKQYVDNNSMPPWPPDAQYKHLAFERILSASDKNKISQWVLGGGQQGNAASAPTPPTYTNSTTQLSSIDFTGKMQNYMVNTASDLYRCFIINTNFSVDKFAAEIEVIPGNSAIVHHVLVFEDTTALIKQKDSADAGAGYTSFFGTGSNDSRLIGEWVPGTAPIKFPNLMGVRLRKNTRIVLQIHYPQGTYLKLDSTRVNIKFAANTASPFFREVFLAPLLAESNLINGPLSIPPNVVKTFTSVMTVTTTVTLPYPAITLLSIAPHMHLIGDKMKVFGLENSTNDTMPLINIPKWDFKWQGIYNFRNPIKVPLGSKLVCQSAYDNRSSNLNNPNSPPITVNQGESTSDEMNLVFFAFTYYFPGDEDIIIDNSPVVGINELQKSIVNTVQLFNVFPNPAKNQAQLNYFAPSNYLAKAKIINMEGKILKEWPTNMQEGYGAINLNIEGLPKGQYFLTIETKSFTKTKQFIIYE
ncbi:MAG: T9SS type A sorting domain-containing protein [Bacteroidota bacterium]|nr:T9SS type A sorting domain-containing protein [Bacteroidota bacterium]MDP3144424.1 T9SS type A sorting domain-containing protein [Bacteroidota bacterium]